MKILYDSYLFDASAQTVVFQGHVSGSLEQRRILSIINVVEGVIIYNLLDPNKGGTIIPDAGGDILTLEYDTTSMSDTDELHIAFEDGVYPASQDDIGGIQSVLPASLGQKIKAQSLPVTIASDQDALPVSIDSIDLPTGASTSAKQDNEIALLTSIEGKDFSSETTLALIKAKTDNLDIAVSALRDALRGAGSKTLTDLETDLAAIKTAVETIDNFISGTKGLVTEDNSAAIKTAVETIDNFISGSRGLVTEDNSAAIKTAVEVIDNFISGSRGLVTEDNSAAIKTSVELLDDAVIADNAQFTDGTTKLHMKGFIYDEVAGTALTENDAAAARINANRAQVGALEDGATRGRYATVTAANALKVDASGVAVPVTDNSGSLTVDAPVGTPVFATLTPSTTGGWDTFMASSSDGSTALTNSAQAIKGSAGTFGGYYIYNPNSSAVYVHIYDVASGSVTVGTTNPKNTFCIPATSGANLEITNGIKYSTAMSCAATTTGGGNTAPSTALEANFLYK